MLVVFNYPQRGETTYEQECDVTLQDNEYIALSYYENGKPVEWRGRAVDAALSHYRLMKTNGIGGATLHRIKPDSNILEGSWNEDGNEGFWSITINTSRIEEKG